MARIVVFSLLVSLVIACTKASVTSLPIDNETMVKILFDVHVAEAALASIQGGPIKDSLANAYYDQVAELHGVDRVDLDSSIAMLQRDPEFTMQLYEKVVELVEKARLQQ